MKSIIEIHKMGGAFFMVILTLLLLALLFCAAFTAFRMFRKQAIATALLNNLILGILYLGSFACVWGFLTQGIGIYQALTAIQEAGDVSPALIIGGIKVSMIAPLYGTGILLTSSILWYLLRSRYNSLSTK